MDETDCGDAFLIRQGLGICQAGETVDDRVQIHVAGLDALGLAAFDGAGQLHGDTAGCPLLFAA